MTIPGLCKSHRKILRSVMSFLLGVLAMGSLASIDAYADEFERLNNEGSTQLEQNRLDDARQSFRQAEIEKPGSPVIRYNVGNVLYRGDQYDSAAVFYQDAMRRNDPTKENLRDVAAYNLGNALFRQGNLESAIEAYKLALIENPEDKEAKYNLEYALRKLHADSTEQDQKKQEENQEPDSTQQDQQQDQNQPDSSNQQPPDSTQQQNQQDQQQDSQDNQQQNAQNDEEEQPPQQNDEQQQQAQAQPEGMTKEDVARILEALKNQERELMKQRRRQTAADANVDKDW